MGACSIEGGNVGGIPDRQQRSRTSHQFTLEPYHNYTLQSTLIRPTMYRNKHKLKPGRTSSHRAPLAPRASDKTSNERSITVSIDNIQPWAQLVASIGAVARAYWYE